MRAACRHKLGRIWSQPSHSFEKLQGSLRLHWFPQSQGDDYEIQHRIRAGKTFGEVPFDELFMLGLERDNDLEMRGHIGTRDGRKGSAPLGRNYFLSNWEADKNVYRNGIFTVKLGPFLDTGKITDASAGLGSQKWLWDLGAQVDGAGFWSGSCVLLWQRPAIREQRFLCHDAVAARTTWGRAPARPGRAAARQAFCLESNLAELRSARTGGVPSPRGSWRLKMRAIMWS